MEEVTRNVSDLAADERRAFELVIGHQLKADQPITIVVRNGSGQADCHQEPRSESPAAGTALPEWCDVYRGLSEAKIADIEADILERANLTRPNR